MRAGWYLVTLVKCPQCEERGGVLYHVDTKAPDWCWKCGWHAGDATMTAQRSKREAKGIAGLSMRELERLVAGD